MHVYVCYVPIVVVCLWRVVTVTVDWDIYVDVMVIVGIITDEEDIVVVVVDTAMDVVVDSTTVNNYDEL